MRSDECTRCKTPYSISNRSRQVVVVTVMLPSWFATFDGCRDDDLWEILRRYAVLDANGVQVFGKFGERKTMVALVAEWREVERKQREGPHAVEAPDRHRSLRSILASGYESVQQRLEGLLREHRDDCTGSGDMDSECLL